MINQKKKNIILIEINQSKNEGLIKKIWKKWFRKKIKLLWDKKENNKLIYKYSLSKFNPKTNYVNYKCYDIKCKGQISIKVNIKQKNSEQFL